MFKRVVMIGVMGVGLVVMRGSDAKAHLAGYQTVNGYLKHVSSFECGMTIYQIPNLDTHPAKFSCRATITEAQLLCENPANHDVQPGVAGTRVVLVGERPVVPGDFTKQKGKAKPNVLIDDNVAALLDPANCVNPNWHPIDVLSTKVEATVETADCTGPVEDPCSSSTPAYREVVRCALPPQYSVTNPPPPGTNYVCIAISKEHLN